MLPPDDAVGSADGRQERDIDGGEHRRCHQGEQPLRTMNLDDEICDLGIDLEHAVDRGLGPVRLNWDVAGKQVGILDHALEGAESVPMGQLAGDLAAQRPDHAFALALILADLRRIGGEDRDALTVVDLDLDDVRATDAFHHGLMHGGDAFGRLERADIEESGCAAALRRAVKQRVRQQLRHRDIVVLCHRLELADRPAAVQHDQQQAREDQGQRRDDGKLARQPELRQRRPGRRVVNQIKGHGAVSR